ncbi:MAG TPA: hypothetical protein PKN95_06350 [Verrucomicrobiota bacterium]|nr:hypothetical protein [Verrucomicrobiota bacterium]HNT15599.1 hypothetical protein [Verrucomicrobiota bacterium]
MKCFYHQEVDAAGLCKSCGRGLCRECIAEVGLSCSCRNRCEADVATLNDLVERGRTAYQKTSATYFQSGWFILLLGIPFLVLGVAGVSSGTGGEWGYFLLTMGVLFMGWGVSHFISARRLRQK